MRTTLFCPAALVNGMARRLLRERTSAPLCGPPGWSISMKSSATWFLVAAIALTACKKGAPEAAMDSAPAAAPAAQTPAHVQDLLTNFQRVHFATDSSTIDEESRSALAANAAILMEHPKVRVQIQGHADERGTTDYNLALGERRAKSVLDALVAEGVGPSRLDIVTYGEEAPIASGHTERAWSQNRRAEFAVVWGEGVTGTTTTR